MVGDTFHFIAEAELALVQGELARAARCIEQLPGKYNGMNLRHLKPGILYLRARISLAAGNKEEAHKTLSDEMDTHREVWAMCSALSKLEMKRGNESASAQLHDRARVEVTIIADHAQTPELREVFLARTDVQLILGA